MEEIDLSAVHVTPRMRAILARAARIGEEHIGSRFIGTENVLRALTEDEGGIAGQVLRDLGVLEDIQSRLDEVMRSQGYRTPARG